MSTKKGGSRPGAGRPKGRLNQSTLDALEVKRKYQDRIRKHADDLFNAQYTLATGYRILLKVELTETGKPMGKPQVVDNPEEIIEFFDELNGKDGIMNGMNYYSVVTKQPDTRTISDMLDRSMGKPDQHMDITSDGEKIERPIIIADIKPRGTSTQTETE